MKPTWVIGILAIIIIVTAIVVAAALGFIQIPGLNIGGLDPGDSDAPPGAVYCDFTDMQILDMIETVSGKDLNNAIGISYVRALNMEACGSDDELGTTIASYYRSLYNAWYISDDASLSGGGWTAYRIVWLNDLDPSSATLVRAVLIGEGTTVKMAYGYDTITIVTDGPAITYAAFMIWVSSS